MSWILSLSPIELGVLIFCLRIVDVSIGTLRTIAVVNGRVPLSVGLGFFEVLLWVFGVSQLFTRIAESPLLILAYAGGFATGNAVGIAIERQLALGMVVMRMLSTNYGKNMVEALTSQGAEQITTFAGHNEAGIVTLIYMIAPRRRVHEITRSARQVDPTLFYTIEPLRQYGSAAGVPLPHATGWRSIFKYK